MSLGNRELLRTTSSRVSPVRGWGCQAVQHERSDQATRYSQMQNVSVQPENSTGHRQMLPPHQGRCLLQHSHGGRPRPNPKWVICRWEKRRCECEGLCRSWQGERCQLQRSRLSSTLCYPLSAHPRACSSGGDRPFQAALAAPGDHPAPQKSQRVFPKPQRNATGWSFPFSSIMLRDSRELPILTTFLKHPTRNSSNTADTCLQVKVWHYP